MHVRATALIGSAALLAASGLAAQVTPNGSEFQVNTYSTSSQSYPRIAADGSGHYVVVWEGSGDGDTTGVFARRYKSSGEPLGAEFRVNDTYTAYFQGYPAVSADDAGNFVVVWHSDGPDGDAYSIQARRFAPDGTPLGPEFTVNSVTAGYQYAPDVAVHDDGSFVVTWASDYVDGSLVGVAARRFDATGAAIGPEFVVNTYTTGWQASYRSGPRVAGGGDGSFVVVWSGENGSGGGGDDYNISGRRYDATGAPLDVLQFSVNNVTVDYQAFPAVAARPDNQFVVAWESYPGIGDFDVFQRRYDTTGAPIGLQVRANDAGADDQFGAAVAYDSSGGFLVTWSSGPDTDGSQIGVFGRAYDPNGVALGTDFQVNTYTTGVQAISAVAGWGPGDFTVVWEDGSDHDGEDSGVFGQRYGDLIFADRVESGGFAFWTTTSNDAGDLSVTPAAALGGSDQGIAALVDDTAGLFAQDDSPNDESRYRARFYLDPNDYDPGEAQLHRRNRLLIGFQDAPQRRLFAVVMRRQSGAYALQTRIRQDNNDQLDTGFFPITNEPHYVEIDWRRSTGPDTNDGSLQLWIDGVSQITVSGMDNSAGIDFVRLGAMNNKGGANGTILLDEFVSRRTNPVGPAN
jgi:hypothetical protein